VRTTLGPLLSSLAQVEETGHAGAPRDLLDLPSGVLNRRHWAANGLLGAAHLLSDQPTVSAAGKASAVAFNDQRVPNIRDKYFVSYLLALIQRMVLNRFIDEANAVAAAGGPSLHEEVDQLRSGLLEFAMSVHLTQVSLRQALQRYHGIAVEGLNLPYSWNEVRQSIADYDARTSTRRQGRLAQGVARNLSTIKGVQELVHLIEFLLASVYLAHMWHMFAAENESLKHWAEHALRIPGEWFVSLGVLVFAALVVGGVAVLNWALRRYREQKDQSVEEITQNE
jgi:hypothetical protein